MLPDRRECAALWNQRVLPQGRKLKPFFVRVAEDPFNRASLIIDTDDEVLAARNDERVVLGTISYGVIVEPIVRCRVNELSRIIPPGNHGRPDDVRQLPGPKHR